MDTSNFITLNFQVRELLYSGPRTKVVRATRISDSSPVILKTLTVPAPTDEDLAVFRHEYRIAKSIPKQASPLAIEFLHLAENWTIIFEDNNKVSLNHLKISYRVLSHDNFLQLVIGITNS